MRWKKSLCFSFFSRTAVTHTHVTGYCINACINVSNVKFPVAGHRLWSLEAGEGLQGQVLFRMNGSCRCQAAAAPKPHSGADRCVHLEDWSSCISV